MENPLQLSSVNFQKGSYIIVEGKQKADRFYIIRSGKIRVSKELEIVAEEGGNILGPGDFFGVVSTMASYNHIETAMALTDVSLISVQKDKYWLLIERNTPVAMKIIHSFSRKMRYLDQSLTKLAFQSTATETLSHLFNVAEYYAKQNLYNQAYYAYYKYIQHAPNGEYVDIAKERMAKIHPYAKVVYLNGGANEFTRTYPKNTMIFSESEPGHELHIIQKGRVKISKIVNNNEVMLALLKPGDIFGEMALIENKPRAASAIAYDDITTLVVSRESFKLMVQKQPQLITRLTQLLAERIWIMYKQLAYTVMTNPLGKMYEALMVQLEKNRIPIITGQAHSFEFGPSELINMVGLSKQEGSQAIKRLFENKNLRLVENKIYLNDMADIQKRAESYKRMERIEKARVNA